MKSLGADPAPIFTTDNRPQQLQQTEETSQQRRDADLERMVDTANEAIAHTRNHVQIERHKPTRRFVMKLVDGDSGDVIRQYPAEDFLKVSERLNDMRGMLFASEG